MSESLLKNAKIIHKESAFLLFLFFTLIVNPPFYICPGCNVAAAKE